MIMIMLIIYYHYEINHVYIFPNIISFSISKTNDVWVNNYSPYYVTYEYINIFLLYVKLYIYKFL